MLFSVLFCASVSAFVVSLLFIRILLLKLKELKLKERLDLQCPFLYRCVVFMTATLRH